MTFRFFDPAVPPPYPRRTPAEPPTTRLRGMAPDHLQLVGVFFDPPHGSLTLDPIGLPIQRNTYCLPKQITLLNVQGLGLYETHTSHTHTHITSNHIMRMMNYRIRAWVSPHSEDDDDHTATDHGGGDGVGEDWDGDNGEEMLGDCVDLDDSVPADAPMCVWVDVYDEDLGLCMSEATLALDRVANSVTRIVINGWKGGNHLTDLGDVMRVCPNISLVHISGGGDGGADGGLLDLSFACGNLSISYAEDIKEIWVSPQNTGSVSVSNCQGVVSLCACPGMASGGPPLMIRNLCIEQCLPTLLNSLCLPSSRLVTISLSNLLAGGPDSLVFDGMTELQDVVVRNCDHISSIVCGHLPALIMASCYDCPSLRSLSFQDLSNLIHVVVYLCLNLEWLHLSGDTCPSLRCARIDRNRLRDECCSFPGRFCELHEFYALDNHLTKLPMDYRHLSRLRTLDLSWNNFVRPVDLSHSPALAHVNFLGNEQPLDVMGRQNVLRIIVQPGAPDHDEWMPEFVQGEHMVMVPCDT